MTNLLLCSVMINHRQSYDLRICADYVLISESSWYTRGGVGTIQPTTGPSLAQSYFFFSFCIYAANLATNIKTQQISEKNLP